MASVIHRKVGKKWHIRFREKGRKEIVKSYPGSLKEKTIADKTVWFKEEIALGRFDPWQQVSQSGSRYLYDLVEDYCNENLASGNWSEKTFNTNRSRLINTLKPVLNRQCSKAIGNKFQDCLDDLDVAPVTKKGYRATVNSFSTWLYKKGYLTTKPETELSISDKITLRNQRSVKYLTWNQVNDISQALEFRSRQLNALYSYPNGRGASYYSDLFWFMFYSLLRKEEVPKLQAKDLLPGGRLRVQGKGRRVDVIPLPPPALDIASKHAKGKRPNEPLIVTHMNRPYVHFKKGIALALGSEHPTGFHQLRHGGVVHYFTLGKPVQFVSKLCRHASVQVTLEVYGDIIPDGLAAAFSDITHEPAI